MRELLSPAMCVEYLNPGPDAEKWRGFYVDTDFPKGYAARISIAGDQLR